MIPIKRATATATTSKDQSNGMDEADTRVREFVLEELRWDPRIKSQFIRVSVRDGIVTLQGSVPHYLEKSYAEKATERVWSVRGIADEIEVTLPGSSQPSDEVLASAAAQALEQNYGVPASVRATVDRGWVTLRGEAEWNFQRNSAHDAVSVLPGIRGVSNEISLKPKVQALDVEYKIDAALRRSIGRGSPEIAIKVSGNAVNVSGLVQSLNERKDVLKAVWSAPGVSSVQDELRVSD